MKQGNHRILLLFLSFFLTISCATTRSTEKGSEIAWSRPLPIFTSVEIQGQPVSEPAIAIDTKGTIYVVCWAKGFGDIFFSRSADGGKSFTKATNISNTPPLSSDHPAVAVDQIGTLYVVWNEASSKFIPEILFIRSSDGGLTWSAQMNISNTRAASSRPIVTVNPAGAVYVVWLEGRGQVFFTRSSDGGLTWSNPKSVSGEQNTNLIFPPALTIDSAGRIYVGWSVGNGPPFFARSTDGGETFSAPKRITEGKPTLALSLATDKNGTLYAAWADGTSGTTEILLARSTDGGETFSSPVNVSRSPQIPSMEPRMVVDRRGRIWVVWNELLIGNPEIFVSYSADSGQTFSAPLNISNAPGDSLLPKIAVDPTGDVAVVWEHGMKQVIFFSKPEDRKRISSRPTGLP